MTYRVTAAVISIFTASVIASANPARALNETPPGFSCTFINGTARTYDKGRFKADKASKVVLDISAIAVDKQTANLQRGDGQATLRVVRAVNALHFIEIVGEGYMNVTTIYDRDVKATKHPAVHSRHFGVLGQPIFAQYQGLCTAK